MSRRRGTAGAATAGPDRVAYAIPKEGAINYFDMVAIPADARIPATPTSSSIS